MKPLPPEVQAMFPADEYAGYPRLAERPWWITIDSSGPRLQSRVEYVRLQDNFRVMTEAGYVRYIEASKRVELPALAPYVATLDFLAEVDRRYPLPHPGFRAGQVWSTKHGVSVTVLQRGIAGGQAKEDFVLIVEPCGLQRTPDVVMQEAYPFLLADPACPKLSPWSPACT